MKTLYVEGVRPKDRYPVSASTPIGSWHDVTAAAKGLTQTMSLMYGVHPQRMSWRVFEASDESAGWYQEEEEE